MYFRSYCLCITTSLFFVVLPHYISLVKGHNGDDKISDWFKCDIEFSDADTQVNNLKECATKHGYELPEEETIESITAEMKKLEAKDFDDGCFTKCWYESLQLLDKDGKIGVEKVPVFYKNSNITEPLLKEITRLYTDCLSPIEAEFKDKELPCKFYAKLEVCIFKKVIENKSSLEELCHTK